MRRRFAGSLKERRRGIASKGHPAAQDKSGRPHCGATGNGEIFLG
jgi:hypothetical protein